MKLLIAIGCTVLGIVLIIIDRHFIKKWSTQEQPIFSNSTNERYFKDGIRRNYMSFTYIFTILGILLILVGVNEIVDLIFGIEIFGFAKDLLTGLFR